MDSPHAFASLLTDRMSEIDLDVDAVANGLDVDVDAVRSWMEGVSIPDDGEIPPLARVLSLPRSLLREARRRASDALDVDDLAEVEEPKLDIGDDDADGPRDATVEESVAVPLLAETVAAVAVVNEPPEVASRAFELLRSPFELIRDRIAHGRDRSRAPTRELSYIEDQRQRMTYQLRAVFTVGGVMAMVLILRVGLARVRLIAFGALDDTHLSPLDGHRGLSETTLRGTTYERRGRRRESNMPARAPDRSKPSHPEVTRQWSPYRSNGVVVNLPDDDVVEPLPVGEKDLRPLEDPDRWDPVMKAQYLASVEEINPAEDLILETRRQVTPIAVDPTD